MVAHSSRSSALCLHLLTPIVFRSSSTQSSHLSLGLLGFLFPPGFHGNTSQHGQPIPIVLLLWIWLYQHVFINLVIPLYEISILIAGKFLDGP
jgi:hypothetical protein